jgi:radical SAM superfamily enzyme YgiQ (UPF0313 family)
MHTALRLGQEVAHRVRQLNPHAHVNFYGLYAWLNAEHLFRAGLADSVIGGEFEQPLLRLTESLELPVPTRRDTARVRESGPPSGVRFPDRYAPPAIARQEWLPPRRESLPDLGRYAHFVRDGEAVPAGYVEATRGCKHTCSHCPITPVYQGRFFAVPREVVLADVRAQVAAGAQHITFGDPDFLNGPSHSLRIGRALHQEFPDLTFDATIKVEHILQHRQVFPELRDLGCAFVVSAVESLSDTVLGHLRKGHTAADVDRALGIMSAAGIPLRPSLVAFTPWTTLDAYLELLHFVQTRELVDCIDPVQYAIRLLIPPGSALLDDPEAAQWLGELDAAALSYRWAHPDPRMDELHERISEIVECGELEQRGIWETFAAITTAAHRAACRKPREQPVAVSAARRPPPRLTESWFC